MIYLLLGALALAGYYWSRGRIRALRRQEWRVLSSAAALAAFTAAAWSGVRGGWLPAAMLVVIGLGLAASARANASRPTAGPGMSEADARRILGVGAEASRGDIQAAYARLMRTVHPDKGGTEGLAAQLNAARDRLLSR